ncbi:MAG TPA: GNAT family N-acetyltransferase [Phototrophicaceae bacterium]|nr:GNAT family N-acetyltransferase [Phototrophicaceae bacterium]
MHIRSAHASDLASLQALYDAWMPTPIPNAQAALNDHHVRVAESEDSAVLGISILTKGGFVWAAVVPLSRRQGIATRLIEDAIQQAAALGLTELSAQIDEDNPAASRLAERFGFQPFLHAVNLSLDLTHWDETELAPMLAQAQAAGIRFVTYADLGDTPEHRRQLYELNKALNATIPREHPQPFTPFETYVAGRITNPKMPHDGIWIVLDGDRWIGMTQVSLEEDYAFQQMTGILPDYRGRGIAQALKLLLIRFVQQNQRPVIRTFNDVTNPAMIAVNEKAGFRQQGRFRWARKTLITASKPAEK